MRKLKDKKIMIYKYINGKDSSGFPIRGYMPVVDPNTTSSLWAYFRQLSATLFYASSTTNIKEECIFIVNWLSFLTPDKADTFYISYNNLLYKVTRIDPYEDYKRDLSLYAKLTTDTLTNLIPYDPTKL